MVAQAIDCYHNSGMSVPKLPSVANESSGSVTQGPDTEVPNAKQMFTSVQGSMSKFVRSKT